MSIRSVAVVRNQLQSYAHRGVFRGLNEQPVRNGKYTFTFVWLGSKPLEFCIDTENGTLAFRRVLPNVARDSHLYDELKSFLSARCDKALPSHQRIDPKRAEILSVNRAGNVTISIKVKNNQYAYGMNRLVNLVHQVFVRLNDLHPDYMCENFDVPQE